jgi:hypothetical protein
MLTQILPVFRATGPLDRMINMRGLWRSQSGIDCSIITRKNKTKRSHPLKWLSDRALLLASLLWHRRFLGCSLGLKRICSLSNRTSEDSNCLVAQWDLPLTIWISWISIKDRDSLGTSQQTSQPLVGTHDRTSWNLISIRWNLKM